MVFLAHSLSVHFHFLAGTQVFDCSIVWDSKPTRCRWNTYISSRLRRSQRTTYLHVFSVRWRWREAECKEQSQNVHFSVDKWIRKILLHGNWLKCFASIAHCLPHSFSLAIIVFYELQLKLWKKILSQMYQRTRIGHVKKNLHFECKLR